MAGRGCGPKRGGGIGRLWVGSVLLAGVLLAHFAARGRTVQWKESLALSGQSATFPLMVPGCAKTTDSCGPTAIVGFTDN